VGKGLKIEQMLSLITMGCVILIALLLKISNRVLLYVGTYSYEVYLLHWPLLYRYSPLYAWLPPAAATMTSLALLMLLAMLLQKGAGHSIDRITPSFSKNT
jgi:peptidoglycan/LPS O-acetylase OafA/YrhL